MTNPTTLPSQVIRVPNLPDGQIVDDQGYGTSDELNFRHTLITNLQRLFGSEGVVIPTQSNGTAPLDFVTQIQNNQASNPITGMPGAYTCQLGTMLYVIDPNDYTQDKVMIAVRNTNDYPNSPPLFKTVTLS